MGLQYKIWWKKQKTASLQRGYMSYLANKDKSNGIILTEKRNETVEYPCISTFRKHVHKKPKTRVLLECNQCSTLFTDGGMPYAIWDMPYAWTPNTIFTYDFWREIMLIAVNPNTIRPFRLDAINCEQLLAMNNT